MANWSALNSCGFPTEMTYYASPSEVERTVLLKIVHNYLKENGITTIENLFHLLHSNYNGVIVHDPEAPGGELKYPHRIVVAFYQSYGGLAVIVPQMAISTSICWRQNCENLLHVPNHPMALCRNHLVESDLDCVSGGNDFYVTPEADDQPPQLAPGDIQDAVHLLIGQYFKTLGKDVPGSNLTVENFKLLNRIQEKPFESGSQVLAYCPVRSSFRVRLQGSGQWYGLCSRSFRDMWACLNLCSGEEKFCADCQSYWTQHTLERIRKKLAELSGLGTHRELLPTDHQNLVALVNAKKNSEVFIEETSKVLKATTTSLYMIDIDTFEYSHLCRNFFQDSRCRKLAVGNGYLCRTCHEKQEASWKILLSEG